MPSSTEKKSCIYNLGYCVGEVCILVGSTIFYLLSCNGGCCSCLFVCCMGCFEGAKDEEIEIIHRM